MDRDTLHTKKYRKFLRDSGVNPQFVPRKLSFMNYYAERFVLSIRQECLNKMIFMGEKSLEQAVSEYVSFYNHERPHQGVGNNLIKPDVEVVLYGEGCKDLKLKQSGRLADVAPTILKMMELKQPAEMTGESLVID